MWSSSAPMVLSFRTKDVQDNTAFETLGARKVEGALKLVGNGYAYRATVQPYQQFRDLLNTPVFSNYGTGYDVTIPNLTDSSGNPIFEKAVVTAPCGTQMVFLPSVGYSTLQFDRPNGTVSGSSVYRLRGEYKTAGTAGNPADKEALISRGPIYRYADRRAAQPGHLEHRVLPRRPGQKANVTQTTRTLSRALTIGELRLQPLARITEVWRTS